MLKLLTMKHLTTFNLINLVRAPILRVNKGSSNISYGFLNPNTVRIRVVGWVLASVLVRIEKLKKKSYTSNIIVVDQEMIVLGMIIS